MDEMRKSTSFRKLERAWANLSSRNNKPEYWDGSEDEKEEKNRTWPSEEADVQCRLYYYLIHHHIPHTRIMVHNPFKGKFIDICIGDYNAPEIIIEIKLLWDMKYFYLINKDLEKLKEMRRKIKKEHLKYDPDFVLCVYVKEELREIGQEKLKELEKKCRDNGIKLIY